MSTSKGSGRTRRKFTPEFKAEVVAMVEASGGKIAQVARELRLHDSSVGNWVREAREAKAGQAPTAAERAEIRELKSELERVTRERDWAATTVRRFIPTRAYSEPAPVVPSISAISIVPRSDRTLRSAWMIAESKRRLGVGPIVVPGGHCPHVSRPRQIARVITSIVTAR